MADRFQGIRVPNPRYDSKNDLIPHTKCPNCGNEIGHTNIRCYHWDGTEQPKQEWQFCNKCGQKLILPTYYTWDKFINRTGTDEALEPVVLTENYHYDLLISDRECPCCHELVKFVNNKTPISFCKKCGQKLDWTTYFEDQKHYTFKVGDIAYFICSNADTSYCMGGEITNIYPSDSGTLIFYEMAKCYTFSREGKQSESSTQASGLLDSLYTSYEQCYSQIDLMFEKEVEDYYNEIKDNLNAILAFPIDYNIQENDAAMEAYNRAIKKFMTKASTNKNMISCRDEYRLEELRLHNKLKAGDEIKIQSTGKICVFNEEGELTTDLAIN